MTESRQQVLDRSVITALIGDDTELARKFELEFLKQAKESLKKLTELFNANDFNQIKEEAHFLKTSAKAVGAQTTATLLQQLEQISEQKDKAKSKELINQISHAIKQVYGVIINES
ncbi:Hpt domain-containing protein [Thalassotalea fusca]